MTYLKILIYALATLMATSTLVFADDDDDDALLDPASLDLPDYLSLPVLPPR
ncbi:MAG: hypothetical protein IH811_09385 [Proteobacteria bacterium]|nr:hypothetical protein [Pseudomonadota bacterium]